MSVMRSVKQRMVLRKRPRSFPIGTTRQWHNGTYTKTGPTTWAYTGRRNDAPAVKPKTLYASLPQQARRERGGFAGLARALGVEKTKEVAAVAQHVVNQMSTWDVRNPPILLPLPVAMATIMTFDLGTEWALYCARRSAAFNDGKIDLGMLDNYVERAKRMHDGKVPDTTVAKASYSGPMTVADINLASWQQFFDEGGSLNQPAWLESSRLKDLRKQFTLLANLHRG